MIKLKVKYFNHAVNRWEYLEENGAAALFDSHPAAQEAIMHTHPREYYADEFEFEPFIICQCGKLILAAEEKKKYRCDDCGRVYDTWGKQCVTYMEPPGYCRRRI